MALLWSEADASNARGSLRQTLREIRAAFAAAGVDALKTDRVTVALERPLVCVDLWDVLDFAKSGRVHPRLLEVERALDHLLDELELIDPAFSAWLLAKRQALHERVLGQLRPILNAAAGPRRAEAARAILNLDPTDEEAARVVIRSRAEAGDVGGALGTYKKLWDLLDDQYDVEPSKETQELIAAIRIAQPPATAPIRVEVLSSPGQRRVANAVILPEMPTRDASLRKPWPELMVSLAAFDGSATKQEHRYLVEGFRRELIACLVRFREWVVRDATLGPSPQSSDGAEYMVEATALEAGDALRVVITLRDLANNTYLWSERMYVSVSNWFAAQQLVVRRITTALNVHLSAERMVSIGHRPPGDLRAYDLWLLGQATFLSFDPENWDRVRNLFRQVIARMPDFAPAYSSLAQLNNSDHIIRPGVFRDAARTEEALTYAREAARLDPIDSRSQLCLAWSHAMLKQYEQAMIYIPLAYELNENDPWTLVSSAACFALCGQHARAREIADHTLQLPLAPSRLQWSYHAAIRFMGGDYEGTVRAALAAGDFGYAPGYKASALFHLGHRKAATEALQHFFEMIRRRWVGKEPPSDANIARWFLHLAPTKNPEDWQHLRDGLIGAGAPIGSLAHNRL